MNQTTPKQGPIRLQEENYRELRKHVLRRDGWRCQLCGSMTSLEVHHKQFRSHSGEDSEHNLITSVPIVTLPPTAYLSGKFASVRTSPWQQGVRILSSSRG